jgi:hypothetical protein
MSSRMGRRIRMIRLVRGKSYPNIQDLCRELQVAERTLFNDIRDLKDDLGIEIQYDKSRRGYFLDSDAREMNFATLNEESAFVLMAALELVKCFCGEALAESLDSALRDEIILYLNDGLADRFQFPEIIKCSCIGEGISRELFIGLCRACLRRESVIVALGEPLPAGEDESELFGMCSTDGREVEIFPHHLVFAPGNWRVAYSLDSDSKTLCEAKLSCIEKIYEGGRKRPTSNASRGKTGKSATMAESSDIN